MIKTRSSDELKARFNRANTQRAAPDGATPGTAPKPLKLRRPEATEADIQREIVAALRLRGYLVTRINANNVQRGDRFMKSYCVFGFPEGGFPDLIAMRDGRVILLEVKRPGGKLRPNQEGFKEFARLHGVAVHVVRSAREALAAIEATAPSGTAPA